MLFKGIGCIIDKPKAVEWYKKSAEQNNANAQFMLGILLSLSPSHITLEIF
jgi:TPR repeat protein